MIAFAFVERLPDLLVHLANESVALQELEVLLHVPSLVHHAEGVVVGDVHQGALHLLDDRGGHVVARRLHLLLIYFAPALIKPPASKAKEWRVPSDLHFSRSSMKAWAEEEALQRGRGGIWAGPALREDPPRPAPALIELPARKSKGVESPPS